MESIREKNLRRKLPREFKDCTEEDMREHTTRLCREFRAMAIERECTEEEIIQFLLKNERLINAIDLLDQIRVEKKVLKG